MPEAKMSLQKSKDKYYIQLLKTLLETRDSSEIFSVEGKQQQQQSLPT